MHKVYFAADHSITNTVVPTMLWCFFLENLKEDLLLLTNLLLRNMMARSLISAPKQCNNRKSFKIFFKPVFAVAPNHM